MKTVLAAAAFALLTLSVSAAERPSGLSSQMMESLLAGRGMGLSMPAEMNGKPGPLHVLELADALELTEAQRRTATELVAGMKAEAVSLGQDLVRGEAGLDASLAVSRPNGAEVQTRVADIAALQGRLRWVHLQAHLAMAAELTPEQVARYGRLRHGH